MAQTPKSDPWAGARQASPRDPWAGLREPTPGAFPPMQIKNPNPFNGILSPDSPGILGIIGRVAGNPTRQESLLAGAGQASGAGIQAIQQRIQAGMDPRSAVMSVLNTPEGMQWFTTPGADPLADIAQFMQMQPKQQDLMSLSPGEAVFDPNSRETVFTNPTENLQTFNGFAELSGLPEADIQDLAAAQMQKDSGQDGTATERAAKRLLERGVISQDVADLMIAGTLSVQPVMNSMNQPTGKFMIADSTGTLQPKILGADDMGGAPLEPSPEEAPAAVAPPPPSKPATPQELKSMAPGQTLQGLEDPADIVRGGGLTASIARGIGNVAGELSPALVPEKMNAYKNALEKIRLDARELRSGNRLAADVKIIDDFVNSIGSSDTPIKVAQTLMAWQDFLDTREAQAVTTLSNAATSIEDRKQASADLVSVNTARSNIPTREALAAKITQLQQEPGPLIQGLTQLPKTVMDAITGLEQDVPEALGTAEQSIEQPAPEAAQPQGGQPVPPVGTVVDGYKFKGGNPNDQSSWEKVK